tara:strand:+ start:591 stop:1331 length:741 start_codon:yes stop_codon:yes gene_type:complete
MPRYKCVVEYDGTPFLGWQFQPDGITVQGAIQEAIAKFTGQSITIHVCGRTDAGVHALGQVFHFDLQLPFDIKKIQGAINYHVRPLPISIVQVNEVDEEFHARFLAKKRYYQYRIINRRSPLAIERNRAWQVPLPLNIDAMQEASKVLIGKHDFSSFRDSQCQAQSPIKTLDDIEINQRDGQLITIDVHAKSFLHHMVRNLVGTLKQIGYGYWRIEHMVQILEAKDRTKAGPTAPAHGLYFMKVDY